jgi:hypothetical protein
MDMDHSFAVRCSLFAVRCSLFAVRCSLFAVRCSLLAVRCSLLAARGWLFADSYRWAALLRAASLLLGCWVAGLLSCCY